MSIICGTDFSPAAADASEVAAALARQWAEELVLVHGIPVTPLVPVTAEAAAGLFDAAQQELERIGARLRQSGISVQTRLEHGFADAAILRLAGSAATSLIVLGSVGERGAHWLLGSTAEKVIRASPLPVLLVREKSSILSWLGGKRTLRILVATDLSPASEASIEWTAAWIDTERPTETAVLYVSNPAQDQKRFGMSGPMDLTRLEAPLREALERELKQLSSRISEKARSIVELNLGRPSDAIVQVATREKADMLVIGTRQEPLLKRLWHGSTSHGVLLRAPMNVVAVPSGAAVAAFPEIRCILAATDFSESGNRAADYAVSLVPPGARLVLMTVASAKERDEAARKLSEIAAHAVFLTSAHVESLVEQNEDVPGTICAAAERLDADLICLGSRGRGAVKKMLLGSVAEAVLTRSRQPVLIATAHPRS